MVDTDVLVRRHHPPLSASAAVGRSASSTAVTVSVPTPAAGGVAYSLDHRKLVRRELLTWAKKIPVVVGKSYDTIRWDTISK